MAPLASASKVTCTSVSTLDNSAPRPSGRPPYTTGTVPLRPDRKNHPPCKMAAVEAVAYLEVAMEAVAYLEAEMRMAVAMKTVEMRMAVAMQTVER